MWYGWLSDYNKVTSITFKGNDLLCLIEAVFVKWLQKSNREIDSALFTESMLISIETLIILAIDQIVLQSDQVADENLCEYLLWILDLYTKL